MGTILRYTISTAPPTLVPTPTKQYFFDSLKKRLTWDAREERVAVRFDNDPQACSEYWYLVDAEDGKGYTVQAAHDFVPVSELENERPLLEKMYGPFTVIGKTYEMEPYYLGNKRNGTEENFEDEFMGQLLRDRENYKAMIYNKALEMFFDPEEKDITGYRDVYVTTPEARPLILQYLESMISVGVDTISDEEYDVKIKEKMARPVKAMKTISYERAKKRARPFWEADPAHDKALIEEGAQEDAPMRAMFMKFNFDGLTP